MKKFDIPEPKKIAPEWTPEQRAEAAPGDLLIQYVMPKLIDRVNRMEWGFKKELYEMQQQFAELKNANRDMYSALHAREKEKGEKKKEGKLTKSMEQLQKVSADPLEPVPVASVAQYDVPNDQWVPKEIDGVKITASVVNTVLSPEGGDFPMKVMAYVMDLSEDARAVLCEMFPE